MTIWKKAEYKGGVEAETYQSLATPSIPTGLVIQAPDGETNTGYYQTSNSEAPNSKLY